MNFNFKDVKEPRGISQFINSGSGLVLKINKISLKKSQGTGKYLPIFDVETKPVTEAGFTGWEGAKGQLGRVSGNAGYYLNGDNQIAGFLGGIKAIAIAMGKESELEAVSADSFETLIEAASKILSTGSYAKFFVAAEEYARPNKANGTRLSFPNRNFVESLDTEPSTLPAFDRSNPKHYKALPKVEAIDAFGTTTKSSGDDLPF